MNKYLAIITLLLLSQISVWGQVVVGTYHLAATNKDYVVVIDDMQNRYKGIMPHDQLKKCQIYLQVESCTPTIEAYLKFDNYFAKIFAKGLKKRMSKVQKYVQRKTAFRTKEARLEAELYMKRNNDITGIPIYGYESGHDYIIYYEQNISGQWFLSYIGEEARSEGDDGLSIDGWQLVLSSEEEIEEISELILKAVAMIKSNSLNPEL